MARSEFFGYYFYSVLLYGCLKFTYRGPNFVQTDSKKSVRISKINKQLIVELIIHFRVDHPTYRYAPPEYSTELNKAQLKLLRRGRKDKETPVEVSVTVHITKSFR